MLPGVIQQVTSWVVRESIVNLTIISIAIHGSLAHRIVVLLLKLFSLNLHISTLVLLHLIQQLLWRLSSKIVCIVIVVLNYCWCSWHSWKTHHAITIHLIVYWNQRHSWNHLLHKSRINHSSELVGTMTNVALLI